MGHIDPHLVKIVPQTAKRFMGAQRYAVVGRVIQDPAKFDNKVLKWYQERKMPVTPVRPPSDKFDNSKPIEGLKVVEKVTDLPDLSKTSLSFIISPKVGITMLQSLFPSPRNATKEPHAIWLQPGAESDEIEAFIKENNLGDRVVLGGPCVLLHGDEARKMAEEAKL